jgi:two-component system NarL family sensor kinase
MTATAAGGVPLRAGAIDAPSIGDTVVYTVERDGARLDVPVTLTDHPFLDLAANNIHTLPYIFFMVLLPALVVARRPRDPAAVTLYLVAVLRFIGYASNTCGTPVIEVATGRLWVTTLAEAVNCVLWACLLHFAMSFPQTWPELRRRPWLVALVYALPFAAYAMTLLVSLPSAPGLRRTWLLVAVALPASNFFAVLVLAAVVTSYLLAPDRIARQRMRLVSFALALLAGGYLLLGRVPEPVLGHPLIPWQYLAIVWVPAQFLLAAAVLRYRLWDIQLILRRSLVYGLVTLTLIGAYLSVAAVLAHVFDTQLGVVPVLLAVVVALSFSAVHTSLRRVVSRLVYGEREDPYEVLRQLGERLESAHTAEIALNQLVSTLVRTLRLSHAAIEVPGLDLPSAGHGRPGPTATVIELVHDGESIGRLVLDPGPDREPFGTSDRRLLEGLARQVSATAHGLLLAARQRRLLEGTVTVLDHLGLGGALRELVDRLSGEVRTRLDCEIRSGPLPAAVEVAAYRIVAEALTNVVRHASARTCTIRVWIEGELQIEVADDGVGLAPGYRPGMGLTSIRERCAELGGRVMIAPGTPRGTVVRCRLPITSPAVPDHTAARLGGSLIASIPGDVM